MRPANLKGVHGAEQSPTAGHHADFLRAGLPTQDSRDLVVDHLRASGDRSVDAHGSIIPDALAQGSAENGNQLKPQTCEANRHPCGVEERIFNRPAGVPASRRRGR